MHVSSSGVIFHDGHGDWLDGFGLLVHEGLSQQEHEEEPCGLSSLELEGVRRALTCTFINSDSLLPCFVGCVVFCWFVCQMMFL